MCWRRVEVGDAWEKLSGEGEGERSASGGEDRGGWLKPTEMQGCAREGIRGRSVCSSQVVRRERVGDHSRTHREGEKSGDMHRWMSRREMELERRRNGAESGREGAADAGATGAGRHTQWGFRVRTWWSEVH